MNAIIRAHVSTKGQEKVHSIAAQRRLLRAQGYEGDQRRMNASNLRRAVSDKSSPRCWRLLKHRTKPWPSSPMPVDRFQHSFKESVPIDELLRKEKVKLHFHREGMIIGKGASSTDILRWDFSVMGAKSYVLNFSENVRRSLEYKRRNGEWGGKAPLGYLNQRDGNNKSTLIS